MAQPPSFDQLPVAVSELQEDITWIKKFLLQKENLNQDNSSSEKFLTVPEAAQFLGLAIQTIYGLISRKQIPCFKRQKRVYFSRPGLIAWLESSRRQTREEIANESQPILVKRGGSR